MDDLRAREEWPNDDALTEIANRMDRDTPAILVKQQGGYDIITKSDLIFFLTKQSK